MIKAYQIRNLFGGGGIIVLSAHADVAEKRSGQVDWHLPLSKEGEKQATVLGDKLTNRLGVEKFDIVMSSDEVYCRNTAAIATSCYLEEVMNLPSVQAPVDHLHPLNVMNEELWGEQLHNYHSHEYGKHLKQLGENFLREVVETATRIKPSGKAKVFICGRPIFMLQFAWTLGECLVSDGEILAKLITNKALEIWPIQGEATAIRFYEGGAISFGNI